MHILNKTIAHIFNIMISNNFQQWQNVLMIDD